MEPDQVVTKEYLDNAISAVEDRLVGRLEATENRIIERMRDMQTELLRGFENFATSFNARMVKVESNQRTLDETTSERLRAVENRLHEIELRLMKDPAA